MTVSIRFRGRFAAGLAMVLASAATSPAWAQEAGQITGTVVSSTTARPLAGAQVFIGGTGIGGLTNSEGTYLLLNVPPGQHTVQVQMIGFGSAQQAVSVAAGGTARANFELSESAIALDQIVVTGAGQAVERRRLGNTIATINTTELETAPIRSASEVLQGREPGISVVRSGGVAGEGSRIRIRGSSSLTQSNAPIIYVDGVRISSGGGYGGAGEASRLDDINPASIARIEVLKGASAATLYGTEASNGVIQIFTKRGQTGDPTWTAELGGGFSKSYSDRYIPLAGFALAEEPTDGRDRGTIGIREYWGIDVEPYEVFQVPLEPHILETGYQQHYALSVSGGSDLMTYYASGRFAGADGILGGNQYGPAEDTDVQKQANANLSMFPSENLRLRLTTRYTDRHHTIPTNGNNTQGMFSMSMMSKPEFANENNPVGWASFATLPEAMQIMVTEDVQRFGGALTASYTPHPEVSLELTSGLDYLNRTGTNFQRFGWNVSGVSGDNPQGEKDVEVRNRRNLTFDGRASWNTALSDQFTSGLVVGAQVLIGSRHTTTVHGEQFPAPGLEVAEAGAEQSVEEDILKTVQAGLFAQEQIGFRNYLFVTAGVRLDKHSAFGESAGAALYPKLGIALVPSDMPGWSQIGPLSTLRLRASIGQSGQQPGAFDKLTTFEPLPAETGPGVQPFNLGNPELKPEVSTELEAGFDAGLYNDRIAVNATYWNRTVTDLLISRQFPPSGGFFNTQLVNLGEMKAWGVELGVDGTVYSSENLSVDVFANGAYLFQEVTDMGGAPPLKIEYYRYRTWIKEDYAPGSFFGLKHADVPYPFDTNEDGEADSREQVLAFLEAGCSLDEPDASCNPDEIPLFLADEDSDGDLLDHYLGKPIPDWSGAFGANITFLSDFTLSSLFEYKAGNFKIQNLSGAFRNTHESLGRNTPRAAQIEATLLNPASTPEERLEAAMGWAYTGASLAPYNSLNYVEDADFIRWRELSLTYRVPAGLAARIGASSLSLTAGARDLMLWTGYTGFSPESNVTTGGSGTGDFVWGIDAWRPPAPRRFTFSARVSF